MAASSSKKAAGLSGGLFVYGGEFRDSLSIGKARYYRH